MKNKICKNYFKNSKYGQGFPNHKRRGLFFTALPCLRAPFFKKRAHNLKNFLKRPTINDGYSQMRSF